MLRRFIAYSRNAMPMAWAALNSLLLASFLLGGSVLRVQARTMPSVSSVQVVAPSDWPWVLCTIGDITVFAIAPRIHVRCTNVILVGADPVAFFAAPGDSANALTTNRFLTLLNTALALGKPIFVTFDPDPANNPADCSPTNCRKILWLTLQP